MDCCNCGLAIGRESGQYTEDEEIVCPDCGATCVVFLDDPNPSYEAPTAYFGSWQCSHGVDGEEWCEFCEARTEGP